MDVGADGITHIRGAMSAFTGTTDRDAIDFTTSKEHNNGTGTNAKKIISRILVKAHLAKLNGIKLLIM